MEIVLSYIANEMNRLSASHVNILKDAAPGIRKGMPPGRHRCLARLCITLLQISRLVNNRIHCLVIKKHV